ncbi:TPA: hypothetical protein ACKQPR_004969, partial [Serratia odorifera]
EKAWTHVQAFLLYSPALMPRRPDSRHGFLALNRNHILITGKNPPSACSQSCPYRNSTVLVNKNAPTKPHAAPLQLTIDPYLGNAAAEGVCCVTAFRDGPHLARHSFLFSKLVCTLDENARN